MGKGRILIVDDEEIALVAFKKELQDEGYIVQTALGGNKALEIVKNDKFDIVYTDLVMTDINGVEVCREVKQISPETDVVLISGHPNEIYEHEPAFIEAGGSDEILRKPLLEDELLHVTDRIMKRKYSNAE